MEALTLDGYGARCTAAVIGDKYTFTLEYPLEPVVQVAAKTAQMMWIFERVTRTSQSSWISRVSMRKSGEPSALRRCGEIRASSVVARCAISGG